MRFQDFDLVGKIVVGEDELGNQSTIDDILGSFSGRFTQWTADDVDVYGRELTSSNRKLLTQAPLALCKQAATVRIDNKDYTVTKVTDYGRWRCLYVKGYRL